MMVAFCALAAPAVFGASTGTLPRTTCDAPLALFVDGLEGDAAIVREPSAGTGGVFPGAVTRSVTVMGVGKSYYLQVPPSYDPQRPLPLLIALHGAAGSPAAAQTAAQQLRSSWGVVGDAEGFIVAAPVASGGSGGWIVPPPSPSDYDTFAAVLTDAAAHYNIDRSRVLLWGFSAGAHVAHDMVLGPYSPGFHIDDVAGYAVAAGVLPALACSGMNAAACDALLANARKIPLWLQVGSSDPLRATMQQDRARFLAQGWVDGETLRYTEFSGGHTYSQAQLAATWAFLCPFQRLP